MNRTRSLHVLAAACVAALSLPAAAESDTTPVRHARHHHTAKKTPHDGAAAGKEAGNASYYAKHFTGHKTASGERYDPNALTAAHRTLPLGTQVRVVNPKNDKSVVVTVNDRGPVPAEPRPRRLVGGRRRARHEEVGRDEGRDAGRRQDDRRPRRGAEAALTAVSTAAARAAGVRSFA